MSEDLKTPTAEHAVASTKQAESDRPKSDSSDNRPPHRGDSRQRSNDGDKKKFSRFRKKVCKFCYNKELPIDYKRSDILVKFLTDRGKILPRRITGTCAKHQRRLAVEVKRARMIALLPFVEQ
jgi:small subunit ribosomal protein S18